MNRPTITKLLVLFAFIIGAVGCGPSLVIQNVDYAQPLESVIQPDSEHLVHDQRYAIKFSMIPILEDEGIPSVDEVRVIRSRAGFYFVTAPGFNNVYVFEPDESELKLKNKIEFPGQGLQQPAFNQRNSHIELIDRSTGETYNLDQSGIRER